MVPGGTNVISGYDPATVRAMNLSRAENLLSQKHQKFYPPPPVPSSHSSQVKYLFFSRRNLVMPIFVFS